MKEKLLFWHFLQFLAACSWQLMICESRKYLFSNPSLQRSQWNLLTIFLSSFLMRGLKLRFWTILQITQNVWLATFITELNEMLESTKMIIYNYWGLFLFLYLCVFEKISTSKTSKSTLKMVTDLLRLDQNVSDFADRNMPFQFFFSEQNFSSRLNSAFWHFYNLHLPYLISLDITDGLIIRLRSVLFRKKLEDCVSDQLNIHGEKGWFSINWFTTPINIRYQLKFNDTWFFVCTTFSTI